MVLYYLKMRNWSIGNSLNSNLSYLLLHIGCYPTTCSIDISYIFLQRIVVFNNIALRFILISSPHHLFPSSLIYLFNCLVSLVLWIQTMMEKLIVMNWLVDY